MKSDEKCDSEWVDESHMHGSLKKLELLAQIKIKFRQDLDFICATVKDIVNNGQSL